MAIAFTLLTLLFLAAEVFYPGFFDWTFDRHQNLLSWYIRPLFIIPFCFFAYKRSWAGITGTIFLLLTSMFWFPKPEVAGEQVISFLKMEKDWLFGDWTFIKVLMTLMVPITLTALGMALWKRNLWFGLSVIVFIAVAKTAWSVVFGGESGKTVIIPAITGLLLCVVLIFIGFRKLEKRKAEERKAEERNGS